jgi:hypothetical protein
MRSVVSLRDEALAAINKFERQAQSLSSEDRQFLDRLRTNDLKFWSHFPKRRRSETNGVRVIELAVMALQAAKALPKIPTETARCKQLREAKTAVRIVRDYFANHRGSEADELQRGLAWAERHFGPFAIGEIFFVRSLTKAEHALAMPAIALNSEIPSPGREYRQPAAQRGMFMMYLRAAMLELFEKPCDGAVAALTDVAFELPNATTIGQVRKACERHQRRNRTTRRKK